MYIEHVFKERFTKGVRWYVKVPKMQSFVGWNAAYIRLITKHLQQALAFIFVTIVYPNIDKHVSIKRQQQTFYIHLITFVFVFCFGHTTENESNIQQSVNIYDYKQLRKVGAFFPLSNHRWVLGMVRVFVFNNLKCQTQNGSLMKAEA